MIFSRPVFLANIHEQLVDFGILVIDDVELFRIALGGVPDLVLVVVGAERPTEHHRVEVSLVDKVLQKDSPFVELDVHFDAELLEIVLNERGDVAPDFVAVIGDEREGKSLAVLLENSVFPRFPAGFGEKLARFFGIIHERV